MWKFLLAVTIVAGLAEGQRSFYAPRPGSYPKLLARYRKNETETTSNPGLGAREGQEKNQSNSTSTFPPQLEGTLEEHSFVRRVSQWPEDKQPFWFKNRYAISSMRDRNIDGGDVNQPSMRTVQRAGPQFQTPFLGSRNAGTRNSFGSAEDNNNEVASQQTEDSLASYLRDIRKN